MSGNDKDDTVTNSQDKSYKQEVSITPKDRVDSGYYSGSGLPPLCYMHALCHCVLSSHLFHSISLHPNFVIC